MLCGDDVSDEGLDNTTEDDSGSANSGETTQTLKGTDVAIVGLMLRPMLAAALSEVVRKRQRQEQEEEEAEDEEDGGGNAKKVALQLELATALEQRLQN